MAERFTPLLERLGLPIGLKRAPFSPAPRPLEMSFEEVVPLDAPPPPPFEPASLVEPTHDPLSVKNNPDLDISGLPKSEIGAGRMFENWQSRQSPSDNPYFATLTAAMPKGEAPLAEVVEKTGLPHEEFVDLTHTLKGVFVLRETPNGLVFENLQHKAYLEDIRKKSQDDSEETVVFAAD